MTREQKAYGVLLAIVSSVFYGTYPILTRFAAACSINNTTILFLRFSFCILFLWGYCLLKQREGLRMPKRAAWSLFALGLIVYSLMSSLNLIALTTIPVSLASLLLCTYPVFVILISVARKKTTLSWLLAVSLAVCIYGLWLVMDVQVGTLRPLGILAGFGASIFYAVYVTCGSMIGETGYPIVRATIMMTGVSCSYAILGISSKEIRFDFEPEGWLWIFAMVIITTVVPVLAFWTAVELTGAVNTSIIGILEPISTVVLSLLVLHEMLSWKQMAGILIAICGITAIQLPQFTEQKRRERENGAESGADHI